MIVKRPASLVAEPHTRNMGATSKGAMNRVPTPKFGAKPTHVGAQFIAPKCATTNVSGVYYEN